MCPVSPGPWRCPACRGELRRLPAAGADDRREHGHWEQRYCAECGITVRHRPGTPLWEVFELEEDGGMSPRGALWIEEVR